MLPSPNCSSVLVAFDFHSGRHLSWCRRTNTVSFFVTGTMLPPATPVLGYCCDRLHRKAARKIERERRKLLAAKRIEVEKRRERLRLQRERDDILARKNGVWQPDASVSPTSRRRMTRPGSKGSLPRTLSAAGNTTTGSGVQLTGSGASPSAPSQAGEALPEGAGVGPTSSTLDSVASLLEAGVAAGGSVGDVEATALLELEQEAHERELAMLEDDDMARAANDALQDAETVLDKSLLTLVCESLSASLKRTFRMHQLMIPYYEDPEFRLSDGQRWWDVSSSLSVVVENLKT